MARKGMKDVEVKGSNVIAPGVHIMEIIKVEPGKTTKGKPKVDLTLENEDGICWDKLNLTEKALGFVKRYFSAIGYDIDDLDYDESKGIVKSFYMPDEDGEDTEWSIEELLIGYEVKVTIKTGDKTYKDGATGETIVKDDPGVKITKIESAEDEEE